MKDKKNTHLPSQGNAIMKLFKRKIHLCELTGLHRQMSSDSILQLIIYHITKIRIIVHHTKKPHLPSQESAVIKNKIGFMYLENWGKMRTFLHRKVRGCTIIIQ